jgi:hypothetical protein
LVEEARARLSSSTGEGLLKQRKTRVEGVFALGKELHGLRRTRFMGRWKVQIQLWLTAAVINIKRAVKQVARTKTAAGSQELIDGDIITGMFASVVKEITDVLYCIKCCLPGYFGNSPIGLTTIVKIISPNFVRIILKLPFLLVFSRLHGRGSFIKDRDF